MSDSGAASEHEQGPDAVDNELGEMALCDCGGLRLSMGPMTLHFAHEEVDALVELVVGGKQMVKARPATSEEAAEPPTPEPEPAADVGKRRRGKPRSLLH